MTVNELTKILSQLPQDATVYTVDGEGHEYCVITNVESHTEMSATKSKTKVTLNWNYERSV